jgi:polyhydroxyalkanoate synthesis repressor PhaR
VAAILIKKYGNRRLYDTRESKYITLDELAARIRSGSDVRIVDAQTGEDLTQATLVQLVLENGTAAKFLPAQLLTQMIRLSDDALAEFFSRYVTNALDVYLQARRGVQTIAAYNPLAQIPVAASDALARMFIANQMPQPYTQGYAYATGAPPYVAPPPPPEEPELEPVGAPPDRERAGSQSERSSERDSDVAAMRRELDELKQVIREGLAARPRKKRRS